MIFEYTCCRNDQKVKPKLVFGFAVCALILVSGCTTSTSALDTRPTAAISIADSTPSIAPSPFEMRDASQDAAETDRLLDEDTIRLAVTAANMKKLDDGSLSWANEATGSSGEVTNIIQRTESGQTCRTFEATRRAYDGVTLYNGDVCLDKRSGWWTRLMHPFGEKA